MTDNTLGGETNEDSAEDEDEKNERYENSLDEWCAGASNDAISIIYNPFLLLIMWIFFEETAILIQYGILPNYYIFYFLFQILCIPT